MQRYQTLLQQTLRSKEVGLDGADRHGKDVGHLFIRSVLQVPQTQDYAIIGRQVLQVFLQHVLLVVSLDVLHRLLLLPHFRTRLFRLHSLLQEVLTLTQVKHTHTTMVGNAVRASSKKGHHHGTQASLATLPKTPPGSPRSLLQGPAEYARSSRRRGADGVAREGQTHFGPRVDSLSPSLCRPA